MSFTRKTGFGAMVATLYVCIAPAFGSNATTIVQNGRKFHPGEITIAAGTTVTFSNQDEFIHQIYVEGNDYAYDSEEQPPGVELKVTFPHTGYYAVRCHIHPKMLLTVHVK
jgi:plastocyanin